MKLANVTGLTAVNYKTMIRDRTTIFWFFVFPILLTVMFGYVMPYLNSSPAFVLSVDRSASSGSALEVYEKLRGIPIFEEDTASSPQSLSDKIAAGTLQLAVFVNEAGQVTVEYHSNMQRWADYISSTLLAVDNGLTIETKEFHKGQPDFSPLDYVIPGILALTVMQIGLFAGTNILIDRTRKILRRLSVNGVSSSEVLVSHMINRLILVVLSAVIILTIGKWIVGVGLNFSNIALLALTILIGALVFLSIGLFISSVFKSPEAGGMFTQVFNFPMSFLCGVFWPIEILPKFLQIAAWCMPLTPFVHVIRGLLLTGISWSSWLLSMGILSFWGLLFFILGTAFFKWE